MSCVERIRRGLIIALVKQEGRMFIIPTCDLNIMRAECHSLVKVDNTLRMCNSDKPGGCPYRKKYEFKQVSNKEIKD